MTLENKLAKFALFEFALLQPEPVQFLKNQLSQYTPVHQQHFLLVLVYPHEATRRKHKSSIVEQFAAYQTQRKLGNASYERALATLYIRCAGVRIPQSVWDSLPELPATVGAAHRELVRSSENHDWNEAEVWNGPAREHLDNILQRDDRVSHRYYTDVLAPVTRALPPSSALLARLGKGAAEQYRELLEYFEDSGLLDLEDALERGKALHWNTAHCESKMRLLALLRDTNAECAETGIPLEIAVVAKLPKRH